MKIEEGKTYIAKSGSVYGPMIARQSPDNLIKHFICADTDLVWDEKGTCLSFMCENEVLQVEQSEIPAGMFVPLETMEQLAKVAHREKYQPKEPTSKIQYYDIHAKPHDTEEAARASNLKDDLEKQIDFIRKKHELYSSSVEFLETFIKLCPEMVEYMLSIHHCKTGE